MEWPVYVALVAGCTVIDVDKGVVDMVPMVADCMPAAGAEERTLHVGGISTAVLMGEEMLNIPESHTSVAAPEEVTEGAVVISVRRDSLGREGCGRIQKVWQQGWGRGADPLQSLLKSEELAP